MKNKVKLKRLLLLIGVFITLISIMFYFIHKLEYENYKKSYNNKLSNIISVVKDNYPFLNDNDIMNIINSTSDTFDFNKYSIDLDRDSIILENDNIYHKFIIIDIFFIVLVIIVLLIIFLVFNKRKDIELNKITKLIERINNKDYSISIDDMSEDELSILKSEIYKVTVMLKEEVEHSKLEKIELKDSLSNISHQIKTPLTSILIMVDNLLDESDNLDSVKIDFLRDIKREVLNINFLVQNLLKLSKLDTDTVIFNCSNVYLNDICNEAIKNVSALCDLKNVNIVLKGDKTPVFVDFKWQVEAITNILKNCVEHSYNDSIIKIEVSSNKVYSCIKIIDSGEGISDKDLPHIFERFYKTSNSKSDSVGIGLALSKSIIENDNGHISVSSSNNGTTFIVKYYLKK